MKAVIIKSRGTAALADIPEPKLRPDYVKIKTVAVAINPTDIHHCSTDGVGRVGGILGLDVSGVVEEVGPECKYIGSTLTKGDKVFGVGHGANLSNENDGAFAEYAMVRDGMLAPMPKNATFEETATFGVAITSVAQAMYMIMGLPLPGEKPLEGAPFILIYGGSTATGTLAIQYAKLSGMTVVTTASPSNFELVKSRGADAVFDYNSPTCASDIKAYTKNSLRYIYDCVSTEAAFAIIAEALPSNDGEKIQVVTHLPADAWPRKDIKPTTILAYTSIGEPFSKFGMDLPAMPNHYEHARMFWELSGKLLAEGKIKAHPVALRSGGLGGIPDGFAEFTSGKVRGAKLVYIVEETGEVGEGQEAAIVAPKLGKQWETEKLA